MKSWRKEIVLVFSGDCVHFVKIISWNASRKKIIIDICKQGDPIGIIFFYISMEMKIMLTFSEIKELPLKNKNNRLKEDTMMILIFFYQCTYSIKY